ncbi:uncharacterized protein MYCFIDRAFT_196288 [Pseudocercospora fijiensis CIRAD86]|uniref:Alpha/beta hydrolase fold-3 domain-containing protein n=1 Tax=Pseudocercospora fijiensis (strain CIRAD86) TaxID=383855 RepID=M2YYY1_PSEFD|nr:uncharacterized protein MYCFIDRAFT_196288 [Pseudocercospora fijiensis CIRAD86]EME82840.1 hypothetical protein MYCFIDRAFT_196288 [Pseudocercospora fijiensis CIRAD86]
MHLLKLIWLNPLQTIRFTYTFVIQASLVVLKRVLLPHVPSYQSFRLQLQRAYLSSCSLTFPNLTWRLPIGDLPEHKAKRLDVGSSVMLYAIPGWTWEKRRCGIGKNIIALYAHGGAYARGEAKMYIESMERWERAATERGWGLTFVSVEYPLSNIAPHPAQRNAFVDAYQCLLKQHIPASNICFMGDSAGGGLCILSSIECIKLGLPQPAGSILMSPWLDMSMRAYEGGNALVETDYLVNANQTIPIFIEQWLNGVSKTSSDVNPLYREPSELLGLNPQLILVGAGDTVLPESKDFARLCQSQSILHRLVCEWGQLHIYALGTQWVDPKVRHKTDGYILDWMEQCQRKAAAATSSI